jgi:hypothetical protein
VVPAILVLATVFSGAFADPGKKPAQVPALNRKVLQFAREHEGKKVGDGECWTLADLALKAAGANRPGTGAYGGFVFGRELKAGEKVLPGDVIQFRKARFQGKTKQGIHYVFDMPQHTAIVFQARGTRLILIHQNFGNTASTRVVRRTAINLADRTQGVWHIYRPQPGAKR